MTFEEILDQAIAMLQRRGRVTYRALKRQFDLDDDYLEDVKAELIKGQRLASDEDGEVLVWIGGTEVLPTPPPPVPPPPLEAEHRQLTILFCDLVGSTALSRQLDPEDYRAAVRAYQAACATVIERFDGHIAQYLGDGLLVYFGYPQAHEDDAQRAVRAGLGIVAAMETRNISLEQHYKVRLAVRLGIHTGLVVVGEMGSGARREQLARGETPNLAARLEGLAAPNTVVISAATWSLVRDYFTCDDLGTHGLKGVATPVQVRRVLGESGVRHRLEAAAPKGLTPLVGREPEVGLLRERWQRVKDGMGQVVILSGEAGIGKSRLAQELKDSVAPEPHICLECRTLPYYQNTALYPVIDLLQRALRWQPDDTPHEKLGKLETILSPYSLAMAEAVPLLAALLALPLPDDRYPPLTLTPQRQRQKTLETLLAMLLAEAARQPVLFIVEDLHWVDSTTLEFLTLLVDQGPTVPILTVLTCRPEFQPPWSLRAHITPLALPRLSPAHVETMVARLTDEMTLPPGMLQQLLVKTDGVPLFVEELTKTVRESGLLRAAQDRYELTGTLPPLAIPTSLHDALMARLDRLSTVKGVAQLGATLGRQFSYALLRAVSPLDESALQRALGQLVQAELLYQRGVPPQATYLFKHALIQDAAYQSLLKSTRQQYHQRVAQVLAEHFPETAETQPELLAHHYTEAGLTEQAVHCWQHAGQHALQRSANQEAIRHLTTGLALLATVPKTPASAQQELDLQIALGPALIALKGATAPEVEQTYARAHALCQQVSETPQRFPILWGLWRFYMNLGALPTARELGEQLAWLAQRTAVPTHRMTAHAALGTTLFQLGDYAAARTHLEQGSPLIDLAAQRSSALSHSVAPGIVCLAYMALTLWCLGSPTQAVQRSQEALALAQELAHPLSLAFAQFFAVTLHYHRREAPAVQTQAEALLTLARAQGFQFYMEYGICGRGWALAVQGQGETSLAQTHQGMTAILGTGNIISQPLCRVICAEAAGHVGQIEEGLRLLAEALEALETNAQGDMRAEAHRLQGELLLRQPTPDAAQAEACFQQALAVARRQQAKSWELRTAISLARLWRRQGKRAEAHELLAPVYSWFTEGFDTADLQEALALLEALA
jgi:class 3 adenylate cyclase/predicted ATPase